MTVKEKTETKEVSSDREKALKLAIEKIEKECRDYECSKMMWPDSEVEIDIVNNEVWLCDYSKTRGGAELVKMLCKEHDVKSSDIDKMCDKNNWAIVL